MSEEGRHAILEYADRICRGEFLWFGCGPVPLGLSPRWNWDVVSGQSWPLLPASSLVVLRYDGSDVKVPWDLSRLQFLPVLGKAWVLTRREQYQRTAKLLLSNWIEGNPVGVGVHWTMAMEVALRAMSMCFALELLWPFAEEESGWLRQVTASLREHLLFIEAHSEFSHLIRSNHYFSNLAGLFTLSCYLEGAGMAERRQRYARLVERELLQQTYPDGGNFEAALGYHVLVLQMCISALLLMRAAKIAPQDEFLDRVRRMVALLEATASATGRVPNAGDCDDGRVELLTEDLKQQAAANSDRHSLIAPGMLGIGAALFHTTGKWPADDAAWYGLTPAGSCASPRETGKIECFPNSGIAVAKQDGAEVLFFAMPNGIRGRGSHTHCDKLSVVVRVDGVELLSDSGTGCYTRDAEMRNRFRSTGAHNTVRVDGQEQNQFSRDTSQLFCMGDDAKTSRISIQTDENGLRLQASHFGYQRIGVVHTRTIFLAENGNIRVQDDLAGNGSHHIEAFFHFHSQWALQPFQKGLSRLACDASGPRPVRFSWDASFELQGEQEAVDLSRAYGSTVKGTRIRAFGQTQLPAQIVTNITWH